MSLCPNSEASNIQTFKHLLLLLLLFGSQFSHSIIPSFTSSPVHQFTISLCSLPQQRSVKHSNPSNYSNICCFCSHCSGPNSLIQSFNHSFIHQFTSSQYLYALFPNSGASNIQTLQTFKHLLLQCLLFGSRAIAFQFHHSPIHQFSSSLIHNALCSLPQQRSVKHSNYSNICCFPTIETMITTKPTTKQRVMSQR